MKQINFHPSTPILRVGNLNASLDYYVQNLGFSIDWRHDSGFASVSRQAANLMLSENDQGRFGSWVYIGVGDVKFLYTEFSERKALVKLPPSNYPWAMEIHVADIDGNVIRFGSEPDPESEFSDWVDWYSEDMG
ncbi:MAG: glyoxalase superfamily protein [Pyrinomonadaceae bacterium]